MFEKFYKLVDKNIVECSLEESWNCNRRIQNNQFGAVRVSTVLLPIAHENNFFETLVFGGTYDGYMLRYETYDEAILGHEKVCNMVDKIAIERGNKLNDLGIK